MTASAIYEGTIRHRRFAERRHEFRHRVALAYLDLGELEGLVDGRLLARRPGLVRFRRRDYLGDPSVSLSDAVRELVRDRSGTAPQGPIRVLTHLRTLGHCFNPVSFYYCFDGDERVQAVVAEVTNTPWGDRHAYVLRRNGEASVLRGRFAKALHVSPFMSMQQHYEWAMTDPGARLSVHIETVEAGRRAFDATLSLRRSSFTRASLARICVRYPAGSARVLALIYGHALALKLKGVALHPRPQARG